ncbi:MAG: hypothetical protein RLZ76_1532 [Bacteroidota bacterium]|jgi:hypothetical protein
MFVTGVTAFSNRANGNESIDFLGDTLYFIPKKPLEIDRPFIYEEQSITAICKQLEEAGTMDIIKQIKEIKKRKDLCDWFTYQLVRQASNLIIPKSVDYLGYTTTKWYLMNQLGYNTSLALSKNGILLYIQSNDMVYNMPSKLIDGAQYICLNYHDYNYTTENIIDQTIIRELRNESKPFSFGISKLPASNPEHYIEKELAFEYGNKEEKIKIHLDSTIRNYFINYPVTEYHNQFNIPLSTETKHSLIRELKKRTEGMNKKRGVEYIMYFTRNAFSYEKDSDYFGREKRLSPEETLLYNKSDCEDRSALFYALVKEIYQLPMIVLEYQDHITVAVKFDKPFGKTIEYNNELFTICEPTPQNVDLKIGQINSKYKKETYQVAFSYQPNKVAFQE